MAGLPINPSFTPLQDIKLQTIDFAWIKQTTKISHLKRAIRLIQLDGNYYSELKQACYDRIGELDPSQKHIRFDNKISMQEKQTIERQLNDWEKFVEVINKGKKPNNNQIFQKQKTHGIQQFDPEEYFNNDPTRQDKKKQAQNQRNKGNQCIRSKDFQQSIKYYTKSIQLDPSAAHTYCNRALAYLKLKQFKKALQDCEQTIKLDSKNIKAYHRKSKALIGLKNRTDAYKALQQALKIEPENGECLSQLKDLREQMNQEQKTKLEGGTKFKKVVIQEDSQQDQQQQKQIQQKK